MYALIACLHNQKTGSYHPIFYFDKPFPGEDRPIIRYKSKGHHTAGFGDVANAMNSIDDMENTLNDMGYTVSVEKSPFIEWDGEGIPADTQLRPHPAKQSTTTP